MKKILFTIALAFFIITVSAQKISNVDFDSIKTVLDAKQTLYKELTDRFIIADSTLTENDIKTIYYGQCFQKDYSPYGTDSKNFDKFKEHYQKSEYDKALPFALKMLEKDPMNMKMTFYALVCYHYLNDMDNKAKMQTRYESVMFSLFMSGDGKTKETAIVVMRISDEYEAMKNMEVENSMQSLSGDCDVMTLKKNDYGIEKLYFNISKPFGTLSKMLKSN